MTATLLLLLTLASSPDPAPPRETVEFIVYTDDPAVTGLHECALALRNLPPDSVCTILPESERPSGGEVL